MNIKEILKQLDELFAQQRSNEVEQFLLKNIRIAQQQHNSDAQITLYNELIGYYRSRGQHEQAIKIARILMELYRINGREDSLSYGTTLLNIATACRAAGRYEEALAFYGQAGQLYEKYLEPGDVRRASLYNNMSMVYQETGQRARAAEYLKRALTILPDGLERAITCTNLAGLYAQSGLEEESSRYLEEALTLFRGKEQDPHYASALSLQAQALALKKEYNKSVELYTEALRQILMHAGENDDFATVCENCARVYDAAGQRQMAGKLLARARLVRIKNGSYDKKLSGLELSEAYYEIYGRPMIAQLFGEYEARIAVGMVGYGSECFGFEDELSADHDYGPAFCMWLTKEDYEQIGAKLQQAYEQLPGSLPGYPVRKVSHRGKGRVGALCIDSFYEDLIGMNKAPENLWQWLQTADEQLATAINGAVFTDKAGIFTGIREQLMHSRPEEVRLRKLVTAIALAAQSGQYNYPRCMKRGDMIAASQCIRIFVEQIMAACYLLNNAYMPYYKWAARGMERLQRLSEVRADLEGLSGSAAGDQEQNVYLIEKICRQIRDELKRQGLTDRDDDFLENHVDRIIERMQERGQWSR